MTVKVCPAIVIVPERAGPAFAATAKATVPSPLPLAPEETVIHPALLDVVQAQPAAAVMVTVGPGPPAAAIAALAGLIVYEQIAA